MLAMSEVSLLINVISSIEDTKMIENEKYSNKTDDLDILPVSSLSKRAYWFVMREQNLLINNKLMALNSNDH